MAVAAVMFCLPVAAHANMTRNYGRAASRACIVNMRNLEAAMESYALERGVPGAGSVTPETLHRAGYLPSVPLCRAHGAYALFVHRGRGGSVRYEAHCSAHGTIAEAPGREIDPRGWFARSMDSPLFTFLLVLAPYLILRWMILRILRLHRLVTAAEACVSRPLPAAARARVLRAGLGCALAAAAPLLFPCQAQANMSRARAYAKMRACVSNMKTLTGAHELYLLENKVARPDLVTPADLRRESYVKGEHRCPAGGVYTFRKTRDVEGRDTWETCCSEHGTVEEAPTRIVDRKEFAEMLGDNPLLLLAALFFGWCYARPFLHAIAWAVLGRERPAPAETA